MKEKVLFGAGKIGRELMDILLYKGEKVAYFIDNNRFGNFEREIEIISLDTYLALDTNKYELILSCGKNNMKQIVQQLKSRNITDFKYYAELDLEDERERIISYSASENLEDVILYHVLKDYKDIFYIDVGSNDPFDCSVTKLFYDTKNACGINIDPLEKLINYTKIERSRDINLCLGVGAEEGTAELYMQQQLSTIIPQNATSQNVQKQIIQIVTLESICEKYIKEGQEISFLKVDVEGAEKSVLLGANFEKYRPWIVVMESTIPCTDIESHEDWETILLDNRYQFVFSSGINRYYVADEHMQLSDRFKNISELRKIYKIYQAKMELL